MSTNSCTSPSPSVRILPISSEIKAPRSSRCPRRAHILDAVGQHGHGSVCIPLRRAPLVSASVSPPSLVQAPSSTPCMPPVSVRGRAQPLQGSPRVSCTVSNASAAALHVHATYRLHAREDLPGRRADTLQDVARPSPLAIVHARDLGFGADIQSMEDSRCPGRQTPGERRASQRR